MFTFNSMFTKLVGFYFCVCLFANPANLWLAAEICALANCSCCRQFLFSKDKNSCAKSTTLAATNPLVASLAAASPPPSAFVPMRPWAESVINIVLLAASLAVASAVTSASERFSCQPLRQLASSGKLWTLGSRKQRPQWQMAANQTHAQRHIRPSVTELLK